MNDFLRDFMKGGANVHVKSHYRVHNGKLVYVKEHEKAGQIGTEAQLHERVQHGKNKAHLLAIDPEDRDEILKHASSLGIKPEVAYQGGKIRDHEGNVEKHGFHYVKFASEEDAKKVHGMLHGQQAAPAAPASELPDGFTIEPQGDNGKLVLKQGNSILAYSSDKAQLVEMAHKEKQALDSVTKDDFSPNPDTSGEIPKTLEAATKKKVDAWVKLANEAMSSGKTKAEVMSIIEEKSAFGPAVLKQIEDQIGEEKPAEAVPEAGNPWGDDTFENIDEWMTAQSAKGGRSAFQASQDFKDALPKLKDAYSKLIPKPMKSFGWDSVKLSDAYSLRELAKLQEQVTSNPENLNTSGGIYIYTKKARKQLDAIAYAVYHKQKEEKKSGTKLEKPAEAAPESVDTPKGKEKAKAPQMATPKGGKGEMGGALGVISAINKHHLDQFPSGKWGFIGAVPHQLMYRHEDGSPLSDKEAGEMQQSQNPSMTAKNNGYKKVIFDNKEDALAFAEKEGFPVQDKSKKEDQPAADEKYTEAAKKAALSSSAAHSATREQFAASAQGLHAPEHAATAYKGHVDAGSKHVLAKMAHKTAAEHAPTPELASFHAKKADDHDAQATVHSEAAAMHEKQHKKNLALKNYADKKKDADAASAQAEKFNTGSEDPTHHDAAAFTHEGAAKGHKEMIQHALQVGGGAGERKANEHAEKANEHEKKAEYHKSAEAAWKASQSGNDASAAKAHAEAMKKAEAAGLHDVAEKHKAKGAEHLEKVEAKPAVREAKATEATVTPQTPENPWKGQDHAAIGKKGEDAGMNGDIEAQIKHFKHAAVVAHHNGDVAMAKHYAGMAKAAMAKAGK